MAQNAAGDPTTRNLYALSVVERVGSVFSLLGFIFIVSTFCFSNAFHKPINRLAFYASFGNGIANIATLMATSYVGAPDSAGCQVQGFLIQMLLPADALWTLAMAINVYLTFYRRYNAAAIRRMEMMYLLCCYGIPAVSAITFLVIRDHEGGKVYGNAMIWCWISEKWELWRILSFYGPIWLVIVLTLFIYLRTGGEIYRNRKQWREFVRKELEEAANEQTWVKRTDIFVISETIAQEHELPEPIMTEHYVPNSAPPTPRAATFAYSVSVTAENANQDGASQHQREVHTSQSHTTLSSTERQSLTDAEWSYARCAILFFVAMFITWIPSSANRLFSFIHDNQSSAVLEYMSAVVLPLQGFWNALIYTVASWSACQVVFRDFYDYNMQLAASVVTRFRSLGRSEEKRLSRDTESQV